jgi:predicted amidohydrolase
VDRAVEAGRLADVPVMVDFGQFVPERPYQDLLLKHLRPGDISTHMYLGRVPMLDKESKVLPYLFEARRRGIIFDVGHGGGSFLFRQAVPAMKQGWIPDSISTDLHVSSMNGGMKNMLNVMSKFLNMGMSLQEVILRSTWNPSREIKRPELGNLSVGSVADLAVLHLQDVPTEVHPQRFWHSHAPIRHHDLHPASMRRAWQSRVTLPTGANQLNRACEVRQLGLGAHSPNSHSIWRTLVGQRQNWRNLIG